ncbi:DUF808 domain-containing protein [Photobacterium kishitanii]|uniref:DUF808 domain-containing protein n=1 Tax=Photobacterium kishitanii TaxID=318456 RepID=UPI001EFDCD35|nr:DUF808 domain-containing protein [Photobacterium kishitanii]
MLDSIAATMDDVALMTKIAAKKTVGVLGDDLALNAEQCSGKNIAADRELPIVSGVAKGSLINKIILIPLALFVSYFAPFLINPMLMLGGFYLCFEGAEKIIESFLKHDEISSADEDLSKSEDIDDLKEFEKQKIKGAVRTDFVLSSEIIIISLGTVADSPIFEQLIVLCFIGLVMTIGVYGFVAIIVKLDDFGFFLVSHSKSNRLIKIIGKTFVNASPIVMRALTAIGTVAMFTVGGGLIAHNLPFVATGLHSVLTSFPPMGGMIDQFFKLAFEALVGIVSGSVIFVIHFFISAIFKKNKK